MMKWQDDREEEAA